MTLPNIAAALRELHLSINQQQDLTKVVIQNAENSRAELKSLTNGAANPLVNRALGSYAQGIVKLRDGSWLLAEPGGILAKYARAIGIDLPPRQPERRPTAEPIDDEQSASNSDHPDTRRVPLPDEPEPGDRQTC